MNKIDNFINKNNFTVLSYDITNKQEGGDSFLTGRMDGE
jgi:hypothetical protein